MATELTAEPTETTAPAVESTASGTWRESLPEDLREVGSLKDIPDVATLAKAYTDAQSFIGRSVRIPGEDASEDVWSDFKGKLTKVPGIAQVPTEDSSPEDWAAFYGQMGRPEESTGYNVGESSDPDTDAAILEQFHKVGLSNNQATAMMEWMRSGNEQVDAQYTKAREEAVGELKTEWGDAYDNKIADARNALRTYGGDALIQELDESGLGNSPALIRAFAGVGANLAEAGPIGDGGQRAFAMTPSEALEQISEVLGNASHPYNDQTHPSHDQAVQRMSTLYQAAYPTEGEPDAFATRFSQAG